MSSKSAILKFFKANFVLVLRNSTVGDVARKVMGDVPIAFVEGAEGTRISEDEIVSIGRHDVSTPLIHVETMGTNTDFCH